MIDIWLNSRLLKNDEMTVQVKYLAWMLLSTICFHYDFLNENLHPYSSIIVSSFFKDTTSEFTEMSSISYPWNNTDYTPKITGVPSHVLLRAEMEVLKAKFENLRLDINYNIKGILNKRGVGGNEFHTSSILDDIRESQEQMHDAITRVTVCRPTLEADFSSTPEGKFTFADDNDML